VSRTATVLAAALIVAAVLASRPLAAAPVPSPLPGFAGAEGRQTIAVIGHGTVEAAPDRAVVTLGVQETRPTAQESQERVNAAMTQVLARLTGLAIPRDRIRTIEINLLPQHRNDGSISGYQAVQRISVTVDDLTLVGRVFDAAVAAGANLLDGVSFTLRDPSAYRSRALAMAVQDARNTANALAGAAGVSISRVLRIEEAGAQLPQPRSIAFAAPATPTPVLPGTLSVTVEARVVYGF
jgi:uncharacterized protein YggE